MRPLLIALVLLSAPYSAPAQNWTRSMLEAHNQVRARAGVPPLAWSTKLAAVAQEWAAHLLRSGGLAHRTTHEFGENLFEIEGGAATPAQVVADWASEAADYNLQRNACRARAVCGHYTQLVWRSTTQVGCAVARGRGREVWVCNYAPPGNWVGQRPY